MSNVLSKEFKQLFNNAIDTILANDGLTVPCLVKYFGSGSTAHCNNCIFDPISGLSSNIYNGTGPSFFPEGGVCPVCMGNGIISNTNVTTETIYLAVIFDSKYWINWSSKSANIPDGMVQILCKAELLPKLRNASELVIDTNLSAYGNYTYERAGDPEPVGLSNHGYIISMWKRK